MPSEFILFLLSWLPSLCLVFLFFGYKTRLAGILFGLLFIVQGAFHSSLGKIDHNIIYPVTAIIMSFSGWGKCYSLDGRKIKEPQKASGLPLFILAMVIGFAFFTAGFVKFLGGWLAPDQMGSWHHFFGSYHVWQRQNYLASIINPIHNYWFWKIQDYVVVLFECLFIASIFKKRYFQGYIVLALIFHTSVFLIFNITITSIFVAYAAFLPWETLLKMVDRSKIDKIARQSLKPLYFVISLILVAAVYLFFLLSKPGNAPLAFLNAFLNYLDMDYRVFQVVVLYTISWFVIILTSLKYWQQRQTQRAL